MQSYITRSLRRALGRLNRGVAFRIALPLAPVAAFWFGGVGWLVVFALLAAGLSAVSAQLLRLADSDPVPLGAVPTDDAVPLRQSLLDEIAANLDSAQIADMQTAALVVALDDAADLSRALGQTVQDEIVHHLARRLEALLRGGDFLARLDSATLGIALSPQRRMDMATIRALAERLQARLAAPLRVNDTWTEPSVSIGFCMQHMIAATPDFDGAKALLESAEIAAEQARDHGPRGICSYASGMQSTAARQRELALTLSQALEDRSIHAHFQPQVDAHSGAICGMEALVRWQRNGALVPPGAFLPDIYALGLSEKLAHRMLEDALDALVSLDDAGLQVPRVAVNLSAEELGLPHLADTILWELERRGLPPERLAVEVLESVVAGAPEQRIERTIARLAAAGCGIELDDFGTGHASITNVRHFAVTRLKIDRGFVSRVDTDPGQRRLAAAIILMARELGLETLAEGVETEAEARVLAELDCQALQGFAIARPMPLDDLVVWIRTRTSATDAAPMPLPAPDIAPLQANVSRGLS